MQALAAGVKHLRDQGTTFRHHKCGNHHKKRNNLPPPVVTQEHVLQYCVGAPTMLWHLCLIVLRNI